MTETTAEQRNRAWRIAERLEGAPFGALSGLIFLLVADAERLADLERVAETDTAENFLQCTDDTKRLMFASYLDESERRKRAERR